MTTPDRPVTIPRPDPVPPCLHCSVPAVAEYDFEESGLAFTRALCEAHVHVHHFAKAWRRYAPAEPAPVARTACGAGHPTMGSIGITCARPEGHYGNHAEIGGIYARSWPRAPEAPPAPALTADELAILAHANNEPRPCDLDWLGHGANELAAKLTDAGYIEATRFALTDKGKAALAAAGKAPGGEEKPAEPQERVIEVVQQISPAQIGFLRWLRDGGDQPRAISAYERHQFIEGGFVKTFNEGPPHMRQRTVITTRGRELLASLDKPADEEPPRAPSPTPAEVEALVAQAREEGRRGGIQATIDRMNRIGLSLLWARNVPVVLTLAAREDWTCGDGVESSAGNNPLEALEKWAAAERDEIKEHLASIIGALGEP